MKRLRRLLFGKKKSEEPEFKTIYMDPLEEFAKTTYGHVPPVISDVSRYLGQNDVSGYFNILKDIFTQRFGESGEKIAKETLLLALAAFDKNKKHYPEDRRIEEAKNDLRDLLDLIRRGAYPAPMLRTFNSELHPKYRGKKPAFRGLLEGVYLAMEEVNPPNTRDRGVLNDYMSVMVYMLAVPWVEKRERFSYPPSQEVKKEFERMFRRELTELKNIRNWREYYREYLSQNLS